MEQQISEAEVAMGDRHAPIIRGHMLRQPVGDRFECRNSVARGFPELLGPAANLALKIVAGPAVVAETDLVGTDSMQFGHRFGHAEIDAASLRRDEARQRTVMEDATIQPLHQVERRAERLGAVVIEHRPRHRDIGRCERFKHAELAVDGMRPAQDRPCRLLAQHHTMRTIVDEIGGVGLSAADPLERHFGIAEAVREKALQCRGIEIRIQRLRHLSS